MNSLSFRIIITDIMVVDETISISSMFQTYGTTEDIWRRMVPVFCKVYYYLFICKSMYIQIRVYRTLLDFAPEWCAK